MTNKISFLSSLLYRPWAISVEYAQNAGGFLVSILDPRFTTEQLEEPKENKPYCVNASSVHDSLKYPEGYDKAPSGSVAVIPIRGELMKYDAFCGPAGMQTISKRIQEADAHKNISSIMLLFDTPGGSADGIIPLTETIKNTQKPITAFIDGGCFSGGMWLASAADKIIASSGMDMVGSIGVMTSFVDMQPVWEMMGVKFHEIYSNFSGDKNKLFRELRQGNYDNYKKEVLDPLALEFRNTIKANRAGATEDQLTGKIFNAKDVLGSLVDEIASFNQAVQITSDMAITAKPINNNNKKRTMKLENIGMATGIEEFELQEDGIFLGAEQANQVEEFINTKVAEASEMKNSYEALTQSLSEVQKQLEDLKAENERLEGVIEIMKKQPAEETKEVVTNNNAVKTDVNPCVYDGKADFTTNLERIKQEYF